jgi:hypothetical protein
MFRRRTSHLVLDHSSVHRSDRVMGMLVNFDVALICTSVCSRHFLQPLNRQIFGVVKASPMRNWPASPPLGHLQPTSLAHTSYPMHGSDEFPMRLGREGHLEELQTFSEIWWTIEDNDCAICPTHLGDGGRGLFALQDSRGHGRLMSYYHFISLGGTEVGRASSAPIRNYHAVKTWQKASMDARAVTTLYSVIVRSYEQFLNTKQKKWLWLTCWELE